MLLLLLLLMFFEREERKRKRKRAGDLEGLYISALFRIHGPSPLHHIITRSKHPIFASSDWFNRCGVTGARSSRAVPSSECVQLSLTPRGAVVTICLKFRSIGIAPHPDIEADVAALRPPHVKINERQSPCLHIYLADTTALIDGNVSKCPFSRGNKTNGMGSC